MTGGISRDFIEQVLARIDLVELIDNRVPLKKKSGQNFFACCPFHTEKTPSFSVNASKQFFHCFGCGASGNAIDFLIRYDHLSFVEAISTLAQQVGLVLPERNYATQHTEHTVLYSLLEKVCQFYQDQLRSHPQASIAIQYLKQRGLSGEIAKQFQLGFAPPGWDQLLKTLGQTTIARQQLVNIGMLIHKNQHEYHDRFRQRIMFPIHDRRGRIIGFGGRVLDQSEPKYLNSPETTIFQKGRELYGLHTVLTSRRQIHCFLIVEGYMDVIALFQHGIDYAVATLGTATTSTHLQRLLRYCQKLIFCFDGDTAGRKAGWRALEIALPLLTEGIDIRFMFLPESEDPDTLIRKEGKPAFEKRLTKAMSLTDFFFHTLTQDINLHEIAGRSQLVKQARDYIQQIPAGLMQQFMVAELAKRARLSATDILPPPKPLKPIRRKPAAETPSALRLAIALLLQHPELGQYLTKPLISLSAPEFSLLSELITLVQQQPQVSTGVLLEYWRNRPEETLVRNLARQEFIAPETGLKHEFLGAIKQLNRLAQEQTIEGLLAKAAQTGLTADEKLRLSQLIQARKSELSDLP